MTKAVEALLWAWTNALGRMPDENTMTKEQVENYWSAYETLLTEAIGELTGLSPEDACKQMRVG